MLELKTKIPSDTWVTATWEEYIKIIENPIYEKAKCYYYNYQLRIENSPVDADHSLDHAFIIFAVSLFPTIKRISIKGLTHCSYRKAGVQECQPDVSYYIGENAQIIPWGTTIINLDNYPPPDLVIEVANTSLADDQGAKRLLYEDLGVKEYWILDVQNVRIIPFAIASGGSRRITESQVLPGLKISVLEEALRRSRSADQSQVGAWLLAEFQSK